MENKKTIIAIVVISVLIISIIGITYIVTTFHSKQTQILTNEINKILESNVLKDDIDLELKTEKKYAIVEKSIKEYILEIKNIYLEMQEINSGINPNNIFSTENMKENDLKEIDIIIEEYKEKSQNLISELEDKLVEENISQNIEDVDISGKKDYYVDIYNTIMLSETMESKFNSIKESTKDEKSMLEEKLKQIDKIKEFLDENSNSWIIKDEKIQFTNLNKMTEYYNILNKIID